MERAMRSPNKQCESERRSFTLLTMKENIIVFAGRFMNRISILKIKHRIDPSALSLQYPTPLEYGSLKSWSGYLR